MNDRKISWEQFQRARGGVDWRRRLAVSHASRNDVSGSTDAVIRRYAKYLQLRRHSSAGERRAVQLYPVFAAADVRWENLESRLPLQLLLLGGCAPRAIRRCLSLSVRVLRVIEEFHFDVRPLLGVSSAVVAHVIAREADAGRDGSAAQMRLAYFGGAAAATALVESKLRLPVGEPERFADAAILLHAKFIQASEMELLPDQATSWMEAYVRIRQEEERLRLERDKLAFRMQRWNERLELERRRRAPASSGTSTGRSKPSAAASD